MLDVLVDFQINLFAIMLLMVLFAIIRIRTDIDSFPKRILRGIILVNISAMVIETVTFLADGASGDLGYLLGNYANAVLFLLGPLLIALWINYVDYKLHRNLERLKKRLYHMHGVMLVLILLLVNFFTPIFFVIDPITHVYDVGPFVLVHHLIIYLMYAYAIYLVVSSKVSEFKGRLKIVMTFFLVPFAGSILQMIDPYLFFTWTTLGVVVLVAYVFLEISTGARDFLTTLFSRQSFEDYVHILIEKKRPFSLLLIDLDHFKEINDSYGHCIGDKVLVEFSVILRCVYASNRMIARLAGDEFIVVFEDGIAPYDVASIEQVIKLMAESPLPQLSILGFSFGHHVYRSGMDLDSLYTGADNRMYDMKRTR